MRGRGRGGRCPRCVPNPCCAVHYNTPLSCDSEAPYQVHPGRFAVSRAPRGRCQIGMQSARMSRVRISVITVSLNAASRIARTLASVRAQRHPAVEHLVIDGGSTDGTLDMLRQCPPDVLVSEPDDGIYYAMEKGARLASGEILYFLNAGDVFFDDEVCSDIVEFFERTGCDAAFGNLMPVMTPDGAPPDHPAFHPGKLLDFSYFSDRRCFYDECMHHQATFYARRIFENCSFISDNPAANGEYHLNMCAFVGHGFKLKHMSRTVARFELGGHSTSDFASEWARFTAARRHLRARFFPRGRSGGGHEPAEYLLEAPSPRNWLRMLSRRTGLHAFLTESRVRLHLSMRRRTAQ